MRHMSGSLLTPLWPPDRCRSMFTAAAPRRLNRTNRDESRERRGPVHAPDVDLAKPSRPGQQVLVASGSGWNLEGVHTAAELIGRVGDVDIKVGVNPDGDLGRSRVCHAGDGRLLSLAGRGWHARRPGGQHCEESGRQARIRSRSSGWRASGGRGPGRQLSFQAPGRWHNGSDPHRDHR
jgi:hypothetical protein